MYVCIYIYIEDTYIYIYTSLAPWSSLSSSSPDGRTLPDGETQWPWRTEQPQNRAQKVPNVPSETLVVVVVVVFVHCSRCCFCSASRGCKRTLPDRETQWPWRTEQPQNRPQKVPNVPSETLVVVVFVHCSRCCFCSASRGCKRTLPDRETQWPWRTEQPQNRPQKVPNVPSETLVVVVFVHCSRCCFCSASRGCKRTPPDRETQWPWRTEQPQNRPQKVPNVPSETLVVVFVHCSRCCFCSASRGCKRTLPDRETQWPWRTEQPQNRPQKVPNVPSETLVVVVFVHCSRCCFCSASRGCKRTLPDGETQWPWRTDSPKIEPKKSLISLVVVVFVPCSRCCFCCPFWNIFFPGALPLVGGVGGYVFISYIYIYISIHIYIYNTPRPGEPRRGSSWDHLFTGLCGVCLGSHFGFHVWISSGFLPGFLPWFSKDVTLKAYFGFHGRFRYYGLGSLACAVRAHFPGQHPRPGRIVAYMIIYI